MVVKNNTYKTTDIAEGVNKMKSEAFLQFMQQKVIAQEKYANIWDGNGQFEAGYSDGWYTLHRRRSPLKNSDAYITGFEHGEKDGKEQRLLNILNKKPL
jgi:hypothetical protein